MPVSNPKYPGEFEQLLLFALLRLGDEAYGVTIRQEIEARTARPVPVGQVYTVLQRLEDRGLVISRQGEPTAERGGRRKRYYQLEPAGARALHTSYANLREMSSGLGAKLARLAEAGSSR
ncbi:MAG TPA: helix-turn-helix transcriptional regulator [Gemmatimonadales bacterium]|jgi:DNA-binding PadR family transcriptional regulator